MGVSGLGSVWHAQCIPSWILSLNIPLLQCISTICFALASNICYLIFIGCVTVWFDLTNYILLVVGHVRSSSFEVAIIICSNISNSLLPLLAGNISNKFETVTNQSDSIVKNVIDTIIIIIIIIIVVVIITIIIIAWRNTFSYVMKRHKNNKMIKLRTFLRHSCGVWWFYSKSSLNTHYLITVKTTSQVNPYNNIQSNVFIVDKTNW